MADTKSGSAGATHAAVLFAPELKDRARDRFADDHLLLDAEGFTAAPWLPASAATVRTVTLVARTHAQARAAAPVVFTSSALTQIERLRLCGPWGNVGVAALAASPWLGAVTNLTLADCALGPSGLDVLLRSPNLAALATLDVSNNELGFEGALVLLALEHLPYGLRELVACGVGFNDGAAGVLAGAPALALLRELWLLDNPFTTNGLNELRRSAVLSGAALHLESDVPERAAR